MKSETFEACVRAAAKRLDAAGIDNSVFEAKQLLAYAQRFGEGTPNRSDTDTVSDDEAERFNALITRRLQREPLQHILGATHFHVITLTTDKRALIPRSDSETVVELALDFVPRDAAIKVADLGTGTGALLAAILAERPNALGIAVESSGEALSLASENFQRLGLGRRIDLISGSWSDWSGWTDCDVIISNPPYIRSDVIQTLAPEVRDYDPIAALDGGADGLAAYREIVALAAAKLKPNATLVLEIGYDQKSSVSTLLRDAGLSVIEARKDLAGNDRAIAAQKR